MKTQVITLASLFTLVLSQGTPSPAPTPVPAPVVTDNQYGTAFYVPLVHGPGPLAGTFDFKAFARGVSVAFNVNGFDVSDETEYTYHIHEKTVPSDGNCNATGDHFDPYHVGSAHKCDSAQPNLCQLGDLSGKHGVLYVEPSAPGVSKAYQDDFLSTTLGNIAFFGNLSIVVHRKRDNFRLNCGNFTQYSVAAGVNDLSGTSINNAPAVQENTSISLVMISSISNGNLSTTSPSRASTTATTSNSVASSGQAAPTSPVDQLNNGVNGQVQASIIMLLIAATVPAFFL